MMSEIIKLIPKSTATQKRVRFAKIQIRTYEELTHRQVATAEFMWGGIKFNAEGLRLYNKRLEIYKEKYAGTCRAIGNLVWELPKIETGLSSVSWNAIPSSAERTIKGTGDHIVPRQVGGEKVLKAYYQGKINSPRELWEFAFKHKLVHVHRILRTENSLLASDKKNPYKLWWKGYKKFGIVIEKKRNIPRKQRTKKMQELVLVA